MVPSDSSRPDRRTARTRRQLKEALFALILEKGYDSVTIEDITGRADLGRTTFYLHYRDKEELLVESINALAEDLIARLNLDSWLSPGGRLIDEADSPAITHKIHEAIRVTFEHAAENARLYQVILRGEGARQARGRQHAIISQIVAGFVGERLRTAAGDLTLPAVPVDVYASYFAGALLSLITWWLESGSAYSAEEMAGIFYTMFFDGGRRALGLER